MTRGSAADSLVSPAELLLTFASVGSFLLSYATQLSKGQVILEGAPHLPAGTALTLWIDIPGRSSFPLAATAGAPAGPESPPALIARFDPGGGELGAVVDEIAAYFSGFRLLVATGGVAPRAILNRYLRSILTCHVIEVDRENGFDPATAPLDLVIVDLDSMADAASGLMRALREYERQGKLGAASSGGHIPILALSEEEARRFEAREHGADEALSNPPLLAEVQSTVLSILARPRVKLVGSSLS